MKPSVNPPVVEVDLNLAALTWGSLTPPYSTIVADPPWEYSEGWPGWSDTERRGLNYSTLSLEDIAALPVADLAEPEAYLFLWTTNRYLEDAFRMVRGWRFTPRQTLVWCKEPQGMGPGGICATTTEFVIIAQRIGPKSNGRKKMTTGVRFDSSWWVWPRGIHSEKPQAFMDLVEAATLPPRVELFARQPRLGWDSWGHGFREPLAVAEQ